MPDDLKSANVFVEHYHKMIDVTSEHFQRRNRSSVWLTIAVGIASLLTWRPEETTPLFLKYLAKDISITDSYRLPLELLQSIFLAIILYLTINLFHHEGSLWRHYKYLGLVEHEIRSRLEIADTSLVFGLQEKLYPKTKIWPQGTIRWAYSTILGLLLLWFLFGRLSGDFLRGSWMSLIIDTLISVLTISYFITYLLAPSLLTRSWNASNLDPRINGDKQ